ncbi:MAG: hypothetical protein H7X84_00060, partial [Verrucomicrobia bacterium]|nr:hypothetical protein [Prolixibacteraceae bacterium]
MKKGSLLVLLSFCSLMAFSQSEVVEFLKVGKEDANKFAKAYLQPYAFALGEGLNNGWYSTAETHHLWGFDFTVGLSAIQVPEGSKSFDLNTLGLSKRVKVNSGSSIAPTVAGADSPGPLVTVVDQQGNRIVEFNSPQGTGLDIVPVPMVQVGFGLIPHTDLIGRFVPEMKYDNNGDEMKIGLWGLGVKHNFKEWIPVIKSLPFDASLFASYSEVNGQSELSFTAADYNPDPNIDVSFQNVDDQSLQMKTKTSKIGLIVSKKFSILTVFGAIGQSSSKSTVDMLGTYPVIATASGGGYEITQKGALKDPIDLEFDTSNLSLEAGLRIKLAVLSLFGSINKSEYTSY